MRSDAWATSTRSLAGLGDAHLSVVGEWGAQRLFERDGGLLSVGLYGTHARVAVAHVDESAIDSLFVWLHERLPPPDPSSAHEITVTFWTYGAHGPAPSWRAISVPSWDEIRDNYAGGKRAKLERLMTGFQPARGGQLVLWHGLPPEPQRHSRSARSGGSGATGASSTTSSTPTAFSGSTRTT